MPATTKCHTCPATGEVIEQHYKVRIKGRLIPKLNELAPVGWGSRAVLGRRDLIHLCPTCRGLLASGKMKPEALQ